MSSPVKLAGVENLSEFRNEPYTDFSCPDNRKRMEDALEAVRRQFGREYFLWIEGRAFRGPRTFESVNPSRPSEIVGIHQQAAPGQAEQAVEAAHAYFREWSRTPVERRAEMLLRVAELMRQRKPELNAWLIYEAGKPWLEAEADVSEAIDFCEYYARQALRFGKPQPVYQFPGEIDEYFCVPLGAGVVISPWNFPLAILTGMTTAALVTGNTVVIKPSSDTPTIAAQFVELLFEAGVPEYAVNLVTGRGSEIGDVLVDHPRTRFINFTGSKEVGLRIVERAARVQPGQIWIKRVIAEMGGKDAIIVEDDADIEKALEGVLISAFGYQGQKCSACSRLILHRDIYEEFVEGLKKRVQQIRVGPAEDPENFMGPVINEGALQKILSYIEVGRKEGKLITGGNRLPLEGYFLEPTVFVDVPAQARIFQEEIFGPVLAVTKANDFDHALELANATEYGLTGSIYTTDREKIERAKREFHVGNLYINRKCTGAMVGVHPFGGFNMSGTNSKAGGPDYLLLFLQGKAVGEKLS